jgi:S-adenosylmethionine hydrolase
VLIIGLLILFGLTNAEQTDQVCGLIVLMSDYGDTDFYVGALKGAIYSIAPNVRIDDITHKIEPYNIRKGAYVWYRAASEFPAETIFIGVVDPGVGTARRSIALKTQDGKYFIGPDNGLFTFVTKEMGLAEARVIDEEKIRKRHPASSHTFHGKDIFGPAAASLAVGVPFEELGPILTDPITFPVGKPEIAGDIIKGEVFDVDQYGNFITNIDRELLGRLGLTLGNRLAISIGEHRLDVPFVKTYGDVPEGEPLGVISSLGTMEFAKNMRSLADSLKVGMGAVVTIRKTQ